MSILGPFHNVPTGGTYVLQSTGTKGDIVLAPINFNGSGVYTGTVPDGSLARFFLIMGG